MANYSFYLESLVIDFYKGFRFALNIYEKLFAFPISFERFLRYFYEKSS